MFVIHIGGNADDASWASADADKCHHRVGPHDVAIHRILAREQALRNALTDDHDGFGAAAIVVVEVAAFDNGDAKSGKESGGNGAELGARIFLLVGVNVA